MNITWTHITIQTSDVDRSIRFFESWCGLRVVNDRRRSGGSTVWMGSAVDHTTERDLLLVLDPEPVTDRMRHFGFQVGSRGDLDIIASRAREAGILHTPPTYIGEELGWYTLIRDPDDHHVEFTFGQAILGLRPNAVDLSVQ